MCAGHDLQQGCLSPVSSDRLIGMGGLRWQHRIAGDIARGDSCEARHGNSPVVGQGKARQPFGLARRSPPASLARQGRTVPSLRGRLLSGVPETASLGRRCWFPPCLPRDLAATSTSSVHRPWSGRGHMEGGLCTHHIAHTMRGEHMRVLNSYQSSWTEAHHDENANGRQATTDCTATTGVTTTATTDPLAAGSPPANGRGIHANATAAPRSPPPCGAWWRASAEYDLQRRRLVGSTRHDDAAFSMDAPWTAWRRETESWA